MNIHEAIPAVIADMDAIKKEQQVKSANGKITYKYRGIDDVYNALNPLLGKYKIFAVPEVLDRQQSERQNSYGNPLIHTVLTIKYTFFAEDGTSVDAVVVGEGMDSGDKSCNKAMSVAFKYACFQVFCIATEELIDPDSENHELGKRTNKGNEKSRPSEEAKAEGNTSSAKAADNQDTSICADCGKGIMANVSKYSIDKYGKPLCVPCQRAYK